MFDKGKQECGGIPEGLLEVVPGPVLAAYLATVDVSTLTGADLVRVLVAKHRMVSFYTAGVYEGMAAVVEHMPYTDEDIEVGYEAAVFEVGTALHLTRRAAEHEMGVAAELKQRLPNVLEMMSSGSVDVRRAKVMINETAHLPVSTAREVVDAVLEAAPTLTTGQLGARLRRLCMETNPAEAEDRYREAVCERRVVAQPTDTGTTNLTIYDAAPDKAAAACDRIDHIARTLKTDGETRTLDQLRADVALDLLCGVAVAKPTRRGVVDIRVDATTLAGLNENPGELGGYGPVVASVARRIVAESHDAEWRVTATHSDTGAVLGCSPTTRRRPTIGQHRQVTAKNPTCVFPGCRMPSTRCDLDHRRPWANGGRTCPCNLVPLCRKHHVCRHDHGWEHQPLPNGDHQWTSPLGLTYTTSGRAPP